MLYGRDWDNIRFYAPGYSQMNYHIGMRADVVVNFVRHGFNSHCIVVASYTSDSMTTRVPGWSLLFRYINILVYTMIIDSKSSNSQRNT